jgi:carbon-monoxide dehydrogenase medium subunit
MIAAAGEDARFIAGGQSLVPMMNFRIVRPSALIDLNGCDDLDYALEQDGTLRIGAMMRQRTAAQHEFIRRRCPLVAEALSEAGPATVRNRATIGGTIANGYPVAELPVVSVCLDAQIVLCSSAGERRVAAGDFFITGMVTAIAPGELLKEVIFPCAGAASRFGFAVCGNHAGGAALAIVAASCTQIGGGRFEQVKVAAAGLQTTPARLKAVEAALTYGAPLQTAYAADIEMLERCESGLEADAGQRDLVWRMVEDAVGQMCDRAGAA